MQCCVMCTNIYAAACIRLAFTCGCFLALIQGNPIGWRCLNMVSTRQQAHNGKPHVGCLAGVAVAFQANDLPNPLVEISAANKPSHVSWTKHTLNPKFPNMEPAMYDKLPNDTIITVKMYDNKGSLTHRRRRVLLGSNSVCCTHFTGADPLYVWLPMLQPQKRRRKKAGLLPPPGHIPDVQAKQPSLAHLPGLPCVASMSHPGHTSCAA